MKTKSSFLIVLLVGYLSLRAFSAFAQSSPQQTTAGATAKKSVQEAQQRLQFLGYEPGSADGAIGTRTITALRKFQSDHNLPVTGEFDQKTLDALNAAKGSGPATAQTTAGQEAAVRIKAHEQYEQVDVGALSLYLGTGIKSLTLNADRTLDDVDAIVTKFTIADKPVELITDKISIDQDDKRFATISTKQFGTIRLTLSQFGGGTVWLTPSQKNAVLNLKAAPTENSSQRWLAESKTDRLVAYLSKREKGYDLNVIGVNGSNQKQLTDGVQDARNPTWSPDGRLIAFAVYEGTGKSALYRVNADGSGRVRLVECAGSGIFPVWSPDGKRIVYEQRSGSNEEMHVIDADGKNDRRLPDSANHFGRAWSPDGTLLAFEILQDREFKVGFMKPDGTEQRVVPGGIGNDNDPIFSNNAKHILFQSDRDGRTAVYLFDTETSNLERLTSATNRNFGPKFTPSGNSIVFFSDRDGPIELYAMNADGSDQHRILDGSAPNGNFSFSPDGQFIVFDSKRDENYQISAVGLNGQDFHQLTKTAGIDKVGPEWQPE